MHYALFTSMNKSLHARVWVCLFVSVSKYRLECWGSLGVFVDWKFVSLTPTYTQTEGTLKRMPCRIPKI